MDELISRKEVIKAIEDEWDGCLGEYSSAHIIRDTCEAIDRVPSAHPEIKPIDYRDCANAMLKMWMLDVVTDGEYYRIMDKLNKYETERRNDG